MELADTILTLFFTKRMSLKMWADVGIIDRELALYKKLSMYLRKVNMVTYGGYKDIVYSRKLREHINLLPIMWYTKATPILQLLLRHFSQIKHSDILKTNQIRGSEIPLWFKKKFGKKLIVRCGYLLSRNITKKYKAEKIIRAAIQLEKSAFTLADMGIVTSAWQRDIVIKHYKLDSTKIKVIPNYVETNVFKPFRGKKKYDLVFIGRGSQEKNIANLLKAIHFLKTEKRKISLLMVGRCCYNSKVKQLIDKYALNVTLKGTVPNFKLPLIINQARIFILPSYYEGHPKTLLEAMSCGIPCIGTDVTGIREDIEHLGTGYLCNTDFKSIAEAIESLLSDESLQSKLGKNARNYILKKFALDKIVQLELEVIKEVLVL
ncbi:glycosyltransferase family 4 protein [Candidatus Borrarchaeum sp.]|uniref:glycosyltransferase family 4 protein n=1 Tax=Candidatus Borrarchaeum sp. TaxID=2846742 RepID=UPI00257CF18E|nr:glycosyltransferase family 4 protein [Candidatus Borrarchaeum sp.]